MIVLLTLEERSWQLNLKRWIESRWIRHILQRNDLSDLSSYISFRIKCTSPALLSVPKLSYLLNFALSHIQCHFLSFISFILFIKYLLQPLFIALNIFTSAYTHDQVSSFHNLLSLLIPSQLLPSRMLLISAFYHSGFCLKLCSLGPYFIPKCQIQHIIFISYLT